MGANDRQVGGTHYQSSVQHWDWVFHNQLDYFQGQITKYVARWRYKNGLQDLEKARHFLEKYIELVRAEQADCKISIHSDPLRGYPDDGSAPGPGYVDQDR